MKFWELISAFRSEKENLISVLNKSKWRKFRVNFENIDQIIINQNREILNEEIPFDLAKEACEKSKLKFYLYHENNRQVLRSNQLSTKGKFEEITPLEILLRFGGKFLEETLEKGSSFVQDK